MKHSRIFAISTLLGLSAAMLACKSEQPPAPAKHSLQTQPAVVSPTSQTTKLMLDGTFSDIKHIAGEGDVLGVEITVSHSQSEPSVTFQCAQGELSKPQYVAASIDGTTVHFKTRDNSQCPAASYTGIIADDTMRLSQDGATPSTKPQILVHVEKPGDRPQKRRAAQVVHSVSKS